MMESVATTRQPLRVVADSHLETPPQARILEGGNVLIAAASDDAVAIAALRARGAEVVVLPNAQGKVDLPRGHKLNGSLLREGLVDEFLIYLAPTLLGRGREMFGMTELTDLSGRRDLDIVDLRRVGPDIRIIARPLPR